MNNRIYLCLAHMSSEELKFIKEVFDTNRVVPLGPDVTVSSSNSSSDKTNASWHYRPAPQPYTSLCSPTASARAMRLWCSRLPSVPHRTRLSILSATPVFVDS